MGELYFKTTGRRIAGTIGGCISLFISVCTWVYLFGVFTNSTTGLIVFLVIIGLLTLWYGYDRLLNAFKNEILLL